MKQNGSRQLQGFLYRVYNNGSLAGQTSTTSYAVGGLGCGTTYTLGVEALDAAGNVSARSTLGAATVACPDTSAPTQPSLLVASGPTQTSLTIGWVGSIDNVGVVGYRVYRDGTLLGNASSTSYAVTGLDCATGYTLGVEAYDAAGNVSPRPDAN